MLGLGIVGTIIVILLIVWLTTDVHPGIFHKYLVSYRFYMFFVNYVVTNK